MTTPKALLSAVPTSGTAREPNNPNAALNRREAIDDLTRLATSLRDSTKLDRRDTISAMRLALWRLERADIDV